MLSVYQHKQRHKRDVRWRSKIRTAAINKGDIIISTCPLVLFLLLFLSSLSSIFSSPLSLPFYLLLSSSFSSPPLSLPFFLLLLAFIITFLQCLFCSFSFWLSCWFILPSFSFFFFPFFSLFIYFAFLLPLIFSSPHFFLLSYSPFSFFVFVSPIFFILSIARSTFLEGALVAEKNKTKNEIEKYSSMVISLQASLKKAESKNFF